MSTTKKTKEIEINKAQIELDALSARAAEATTISVTLAINTLSGHGTIAFSPLPEGREIECTNMLINGLEQLIKIERDNLLRLMTKAEAEKLVAEHVHTHNGAKEPKEA